MLFYGEKLAHFYSYWTENVILWVHGHSAGFSYISRKLKPFPIYEIIILVEGLVFSIILTHTDALIRCENHI